MTRTAISVALCTVVILIIVGLTGCQPAAPDTNRNAAATTSTPAQPTFNPAAIEAEVLKVDREWANVIKSYDVDAMRRIEAEDVVLVYPDGSTGTKADDIRDIEAKNLTVESFEMVDPKVTVLGADAAFVTGRSIIKKGKYKRPDGKMIDISGEYRFTDIFARRNGNWQVIASQATKIENPTPAPAAKPSPSAATSASPTASKRPSPAASKSP